MKKIMNYTRSMGVVLLMTVFTVALSQAQEQQTPAETGINAKFGFKGGVNLSNLYNVTVTDNNMRLGFNLGVFAKLPLGKGISLQPELLYTTKGSKIKYSNFALGDGEYRFNLNYLEVPLLLVFNVGRNFNIQLGGYGAYLTNVNITDAKDNGTINEIAQLNANDFVRWDAGLVGGLAFDINKITIGARYNYGLVKVGNSGVSSQLVGNSKNSVLSFYLGVGL